MSPNLEINPQGEKLSTGNRGLKIFGSLGPTGKGERAREEPQVVRGHPLVRIQGNCLPRKHPPLDKPCGTEPRFGCGRVAEGGLGEPERIHSSGLLAWSEIDPSYVADRINYA